MKLFAGGSPLSGAERVSDAGGVGLSFRATVAVGVALVLGVGVTAAISLDRSVEGLERRMVARGVQQAVGAARIFADLGRPSAANTARALDVLLDDHLRVQAASAAFLVEAAEAGGRGTEYIVDVFRQVAVRSPIERIDVVPSAGRGEAYGTLASPLLWREFEPVLQTLTSEEGGELRTAGVPLREGERGAVKVAGAGLAHRGGVVRLEYRVDTREADSVYGAGGGELARDLAVEQVGAAARLMAHAVELAVEADWPAARIGVRFEELVGRTAVERIVVLTTGGVQSYGSATAAARARGRVPSHRGALLALAAEGQGASPLEGWYDDNRRWVAGAAAGRRGITLSLEQSTYTGRGTLVETAWQSEADRLSAVNGLAGLWIVELTDDGPVLVAAAPRAGRGAAAGGGDAWDRWSEFHRRRAAEAVDAPAGSAEAFMDVLRPAGARVVSSAILDGPSSAAGAHRVVVVEEGAAQAAGEMRDQAVWLVASALVLLVVLAGTTIVTTRKVVTEPIEAVAEAAQTLRAGVRPEPEMLARMGRRRDEIGALARHFDAMAGEILMRQEELNSTVRERTRSLSEANERIRASQAITDREITVAQEVQRALAPRPAWSFGDYELRCRVAPARRLSGDFLNVHPRKDKDDVFAAISDVSGKGAGAALFMAVSQTVLAGAAGRNRELSALLFDANRRLCARNPVGMFVTSLAVSFVPGRPAVEYVCAGHESPFLVLPEGGVRKLERQENIPLGVDTESIFDSTVIDLEPGHTFVAYTDGVTDALNVAGEAFGEKRLMQLLDEFPPGGGVDDLLDAVWTATDTFAEGADAADDKTVLVVRRMESGTPVSAAGI